MSIIDPTQTQQLKSEAKKGSIGFLLLAFIGAVLLLGTSAAAGFGLAVYFDKFRIMMLNSVFGGWDSGMGNSLLWVLPVGLVASFIAWALYKSANRSYRGRPGYALVGPLTLWLAGLATGFWYGTSMWTQPLAVGTFVDPTFGHNTPWGTTQWMWYGAQQWGPITLTVLAVLSFILGIFFRISSRAHGRNAASALSNGQKAPGVVTEATTTGVSQGRIVMAWTVQFTDLNGTQRSVTKTGLFPGGKAPKTGDAATVLYDPQNPDDEKKVFLALGSGVTDADFANSLSTSGN